MIPDPLISFIVPAHNEEAFLPATLVSIHSAAKAVRLRYEIIVVNDASSDRTAELASAAGARVQSVNLRKISAVRNAGARAANGDVFIFVDADTCVTVPLIRAAIATLARGAVGGGALVAFDHTAAPWSRAALRTWNMLARFLRWAAGCFIFVHRDAFEAVGGFDERFFVAEEIILTEALKQQGRFNILGEHSITSSRKTKHYSFVEMIAIFHRLSWGGKQSWQRREGLDHWYARRTSPLDKGG